MSDPGDPHSTRLDPGDRDPNILDQSSYPNAMLDPSEAPPNRMVNQSDQDPNDPSDSDTQSDSYDPCDSDDLYDSYDPSDSDSEEGKPPHDGHPPDGAEEGHPPHDGQPPNGAQMCKNIQKPPEKADKMCDNIQNEYETDYEIVCPGNFSVQFPDIPYKSELNVTRKLYRSVICDVFNFPATKYNKCRIHRTENLDLKYKKNPTIYLSKLPTEINPPHMPHVFKSPPIPKLGFPFLFSMVNKSYRPLEPTPFEIKPAKRKWDRAVKSLLDGPNSQTYEQPPQQQPQPDPVPQYPYRQRLRQVETLLPERIGPSPNIPWEQLGSNHDFFGIMVKNGVQHQHKKTQTVQSLRGNNRYVLEEPSSTMSSEVFYNISICNGFKIEEPEIEQANRETEIIVNMPSMIYKSQEILQIYAGELLG